LNYASIEANHVEVIEIEKGAKDRSPWSVADSQAYRCFLHVIIEDEVCAVCLVESVDEGKQ
jgi:predicted RNase H-like nuclease